MPAPRCESCDTYDVELEIHGPLQLQRIVDKLKAAVRDGTLRLVASGAAVAVGDMPAFLEIGDDGTLPDVLEYALACRRCGQRFRLSCETYHGTGGSWRRV